MPTFNARHLAMPLKVALIVMLLWLNACHRDAPPAAASSSSAASQEWQTFAQRFMEAYFQAQPLFAAQAGRHEFDGKLPDLSAAGIQHEIDRLHTQLKELDAIDATRLSARERFDREYLRHVIHQDLFWMERAQYPFTNPAWYMPQLDPDVFLTRDYAPLATRMKAYIDYAHAIPQVAQAIRNNLRTPLPRSYVEFGVQVFEGFAQFYRQDVPAVFNSIQDESLQQQLKQADDAAAQSMQALAKWFISQRPRATHDFALGKDLFAAMLKDTEDIDLPLEQIEAAGRADLQRNLAALKQACRHYLPRGSVKQCVAQMAADKPQGSAVEGARAQLATLKSFVKQHNVVSIPTNEDALVAEAPPYNRTNGAYISLPGPYDRKVSATYYIAPPDPNWTAAEQAAYIPSKAVLTFTSVHEVWPGHFLQYLHSNRNPNKLEGLWVGYGFAEGWAHYAEETMYEMGLGKGDDAPSAELHIGQLSEALLRDVRLLSAIGLHTQGMSLAESEKMFREQGLQDPGNARQQAARGAYDPAYLNYTLCKLIIRKLRSDWLIQHHYDPNDQQHWHEFHDELLSYGGPPLPLIREQLLGAAAGNDLL